MPSKYLRRHQWWVKLRHPGTGAIVRESLETTDEARAELLRQRLDHEVALLEPRFRVANIPPRLSEVLGLSGEASLNGCGRGELSANGNISANVPSAKNARVDDAVTAYLRYIA